MDTYLAVVQNLVDRLGDKQNLATVTSNHKQKPISSLYVHIEKIIIINNQTFDYPHDDLCSTPCPLTSDNSKNPWLHSPLGSNASVRRLSETRACSWLLCKGWLHLGGQRHVSLEPFSLRGSTCRHVKISDHPLGKRVIRLLFI